MKNNSITQSIDNNYRPYIFILTGIAIFLRFLWPLDASFINDEALILSKALVAAKNGEFMTLGLMGTKGVQYGPLGIWFYRGILFFTKDIFIIGLFKTLLVTGVTLTSLLWLLHHHRFLPKILLPLVFLSPYIWFYERNIWDNSLNISITITLFTSYLVFLKQAKWWQLFITFLSMALAFLIHLMSLAISLPILVHFLYFRRDWIKKNLLPLIGMLAPVIFLASPYIWYLLTGRGETTSSGNSLSARSLFFSLFGARFFTSFDFSYFLGKGWQGSLDLPGILNGVPKIICGIPAIAFGISWLGGFESAKILIKNFKNPKDWTPEFHVASVSIGIFLAHSLLNFAGSLKVHPHYYNSVWVIYLLFLGIGINKIGQWKYGKFIGQIQAFSLLASLMIISFTIHHNGGSKNIHYGPTLKNQLFVVNQLRSYNKDVGVKYISQNQRLFPHVFSLLKDLSSKTNDEVKKFKGKVSVEYRDQSPFTGHIIIKEIP